jgi:hypothetical protein
MTGAIADAARAATMVGEGMDGSIPLSRSPPTLLIMGTALPSLIRLLSLKLVNGYRDSVFRSGWRCQRWPRLAT